MSRSAMPDLDDTMQKQEIADVLRRLVFTAARDWRRSVYMTRRARDTIVAALDAQIDRET